MINSASAIHTNSDVYVSSTPPTDEVESPICKESLNQGPIIGHTSSTPPSPLHFCHVECLEQWAQSHNHERDHLLCALCKKSIDHSAFFKSNPININVSDLTYSDFFTDGDEDDSKIDYSQIAHAVGNVATTLFCTVANLPSSSITALLATQAALTMSIAEIAILSDYTVEMQNIMVTNPDFSPLNFGVECLIGAAVGRLNAQFITAFTH